MKVYQDKEVKVTLGNKEFNCRYVEREWNTLKGVSSPEGHIHELMVLEPEEETHFSEGKIHSMGMPTVGCGGSFEACVEQLRHLYDFWEFAKSSDSLEKARELWYATEQYRLYRPE